MRTLILGAAGVLMSGTAWAATDTGYLDLSNQHNEVDAAGVTTNGDGVAISGATAFNVTDALQLHIDGQVAQLDNTVDDDTAFGGTAHLVTRQQNWMAGGFAGGYDSDLTDSIFGGGVEGALYFNRFTVAGALAYADQDDFNTDAVIAQAQGRFFVTDNFRIDGIVDYVDFDIAGVSVDAPVVGAGAEYKFGESPISIFGSYSHMDLDEFNQETDMASIGLRFNLDSTLAHRETSGASLISVPSLATLF